MFSERMVLQKITRYMRETFFGYSGESESSIFEQNPSTISNIEM